MKRTLLVLVCVVAAACADDNASGDDARARDAAANVDGPLAHADAPPPQDPLDGAGSATLVQGGFQFVEGPVWRPATGMLLFSDIDANTIYRLTTPSSIDVFRADSGNSNGLAEHIDGSLLAAEHGNRHVSRTTAAGQVVDVASMYQGMRLNSPNDIAVRSDGTIYFTDPPYGISAGQQELSFNGVFRVPAAGGLVAEWQGPLSARPNGVVLSLDERVLYVSDTAGPVRAYDVGSDAALSGERVFTSDVSGADGMCLDQAGNLFVTTTNGVMAFAPDGSAWGTIAVPEVPANCTFGGSDYRTMYVTARTGLYQIAMPIAGRH